MLNYAKQPYNHTSSHYLFFSPAMGLIQRIVRNEAVQSDPPEIYNARVLLISLAVGGHFAEQTGTRARSLIALRRRVEAHFFSAWIWELLVESLLWRLSRGNSWKPLCTASVQC